MIFAIEIQYTGNFYLVFAFLWAGSQFFLEALLNSDILNFATTLANIVGAEPLPLPPPPRPVFLALWSTHPSPSDFDVQGGSSF